MDFIRLTELIKTNNELHPIREANCIVNIEAIAMVSESQMDTAIGGAHIIGSTKKFIISHVGTREGRMITVKERISEIGKLILDAQTGVEVLATIKDTDLEKD